MLAVVVGTLPRFAIGADTSPGMIVRVEVPRVRTARGDCAQAPRTIRHATTMRLWVVQPVSL
jgi:hypothetical protein